MNLSKQELLQQTLDTLRSAIPEIRGVLVASTDGLPMAQNLSGSEDPNRVAAMAATALGLGKRISETLKTGTMNETSVAGSNGQILLYAISTKGVLVVVAPENVNIGLIHLEAREATRNLVAVL